MYFLVGGEKDVKEEQRGNINDAKVKILLKRNFVGTWKELMFEPYLKRFLLFDYQFFPSGISKVCQGAAHAKTRLR